MRITNEVLYTEIKNIKEDTMEIKKENKEQWKQINKNTINISVGKAVSGAIAFIISIMTTLLVAFGIKR